MNIVSFPILFPFSKKEFCASPWYIVCFNDTPLGEHDTAVGGARHYFLFIFSLLPFFSVFSFPVTVG